MPPADAYYRYRLIYLLLAAAGWDQLPADLPSLRLVQPALHQAAAVQFLQSEHSRFSKHSPF